MALPEYVSIVTEADREADGVYLINSGIVLSFEFQLGENREIKIPLNQSSLSSQSFWLRAWFSDEPYGDELLFRDHPSTGGITYRFVDEGISPIPTPELLGTARSQFSGITNIRTEVLIRQTPGIWYLNIQNLENRQNGLLLSFEDAIIGGALVVADGSFSNEFSVEFE